MEADWNIEETKKDVRERETHPANNKPKEKNKQTNKQTNEKPIQSNDTNDTSFLLT